MMPSVNVIYIRIDHKLIPIFYHKQNKRKNALGSGKISKLKKKQISTTVITSTTHYESNNLLLQPENLSTV